MAKSITLNGAVQKGSRVESTDTVDLMIEQWRLQLPDVDFVSMAVVKRIVRISLLLERESSAALARFKLDAGEFDVLATLLRVGPPHALNPTQLFKSLFITSGGITSRIDRLERARLVRRQSDPTDRRGVLVVLTSKGISTGERAVRAQLEAHEKILHSITSTERVELANRMRAFLVAMEIEGTSG